jgi:hypothetical protein
MAPGRFEPRRFTEECKDDRENNEGRSEASAELTDKVNLDPTETNVKVQFATVDLT